MAKIDGPGKPKTDGRLSTHVLDTLSGKPAEGVKIELFEVGASASSKLLETVTNSDGRTDKPLIGFGRVRHTRHRPRHNAFVYPTYFLMLPMRSLRRDGPGALARNRPAALAFHDRDHGDGRDDALAWLESVLEGHGITDADGEVWLHTYPRVLGYTFKPVSFWYCHRADGSLRAVLAEVNNTFGEHHNYLVCHPDRRPIRADDWLETDKVFHVSPFFAVAGRYRFRFVDRDGRSRMRIDYFDDQGLVLSTAIGGTSCTFRAASLIRALFAYPLMTLGVIVRIHYHALRLAWRRVPFFSKPEPPTQRTI